VVVVFVVAELWQLFFGAGTSLALANPRVGEGAAWVPNLLVGETYTILPLGFILCLWGAPWGRRLAAVCAAASIALAFPASVTVSARPLDVCELRSQQGKRDHGHTVLASIGGWTGRDDDHIEEVGTDSVAQPHELANVVVPDRSRELALDRHDSPVRSLNDQIHLVFVWLASSHVQHRAL
jgi:hypothetical protein